MKRSGGLPHLDLEKEGNSKHVAPSWHSSASRAAVGAMAEIKASAALSLAAGVDGCRENSPVPVAQAIVLCSRTRRSRAHHLT